MPEIHAHPENQRHPVKLLEIWISHAQQLPSDGSSTSWADFFPFYSTKQNNLALHPRPCLQRQDSNTDLLFILGHIFSFPHRLPLKPLYINDPTESSVQKPRNDKAIKTSIPTVFCWRHLPEWSYIPLWFNLILGDWVLNCQNFWCMLTYM